MKVFLLFTIVTCKKKKKDEERKVDLGGNRKELALHLTHQFSINTPHSVNS